MGGTGGRVLVVEFDIRVVVCGVVRLLVRGLVLPWVQGRDITVNEMASVADQKVFMLL